HNDTNSPFRLISFTALAGAPRRTRKAAAARGIGASYSLTRMVMRVRGTGRCVNDGRSRAHRRAVAGVGFSANHWQGFVKFSVRAGFRGRRDARMLGTRLDLGRVRAARRV